jgi:hypothetical protein
MITGVEIVTGTVDGITIVLGIVMSTEAERKEEEIKTTAQRKKQDTMKAT